MQAYDVVGGKNGSGGFIEVFNDRGEMLRVEGLEKLVRKSAQKALPG